MRLAVIVAVALLSGPACSESERTGGIEQLGDTRAGPDGGLGGVADGAPDGTVEDTERDTTAGDTEKPDTTVEDTDKPDTTVEDTKPEIVDTTPETVAETTAETIAEVETSETAVVECEGDKCDDANLCTEDLCLAAGGCSWAPVVGCANDQECIGRAPGGSCDDGDPTTTADLCLVGWCRGFALTRIPASAVGGQESLIVTELDDRDGSPTGWDAVVRTVDLLQREGFALADMSAPKAPDIDGETFQEARFAGLDEGFVGDSAGRLWSAESGAWTRDNAWDAALGASGRSIVNALLTVRGAGVGVPRGARLMWVAGGDDSEWLRFCKQSAQGVLNVSCSTQVLGSEDGASVPRALAGIPECDGAGVCPSASLIAGADAGLGGGFNYTEVYTSQSGLAATWSPGFVPDTPAERATRAIAAWSDDNGPHFLVVGDDGYLLVRRPNGSFGGPLGVKDGQVLRDFSGVWAGAGVVIASAHRASQGSFGTLVYELWVAASDSDLESPGSWAIVELGRHPDVGASGTYDLHGRGDGEVRVVGAVRRADDLLGRLDGAVWVRTR